MQKKTVLIFSVFVVYIIFQFLWWEVLLVKQSNEIIKEKQKIVALSSSNDEIIFRDIAELELKKNKQVYMIVGEGTVFLLILLIGILKVRSSIKKEMELNEQQQNFILSISHELKTPIAASKLQLQTLLKHELTRDKQVTLLTNALTETERLNKLVENILIANQIGNDNIALQLENFDLTDLLKNTADRYFPKELANNQLKLIINESLVINGDRDLIQSVMINLFENAIKYSFNSIDIEASLLKHGNSIVLQISDKGIGITDLDKTKVFQKFYRSGNENTRKTKGTGIGLYLVKSICDLHKAVITIKNNTPSGTIFKVEFV